MKVDLTNQSFEDIRIKNISLIGGNFVRCNFSGSQFEYRHQWSEPQWSFVIRLQVEEYQIHELNKLEGHEGPVSIVCFSPDRTTLVSSGGSIYGGCDFSIRLWDVKTGQQKAKLDGHTSQVQSVCFSPDGITLASGSGDKSIRLWDVKIGYLICLIRF